MTEGSLRPLLVVWPDRFALHERFARRLNGVIPVVLDRRQGPRRRVETAAASNRRRTERRRFATSEARERFRGMGYQLVYTFPGGPDRDTVLFALAFCGECERLLQFEMPRFVETPASVGGTVRHERPAHLVELEALTASGRLLLACQVNASEVDM